MQYYKKERRTVTKNKPNAGFWKMIFPQQTAKTEQSQAIFFAQYFAIDVDDEDALNAHNHITQRTQESKSKTNKKKLMKISPNSS